MDRPKCKCKKDNKLPYCSSAEFWIKAIEKKTGEKFQLQVARAIYSTYLEAPVQESQKDAYEKSVEQIVKDLDRTFPGQKHFIRAAGTTGITQLKNLLRATAKRHMASGYVQGMNFIAGALIYHSCESVAFWLFAQLMQRFHLRDVYKPGMSGFAMHCTILDFFLQAKFEDVWEVMVLLFYFNFRTKKALEQFISRCHGLLAYSPL